MYRFPTSHLLFTLFSFEFYRLLKIKRILNSSIALYPHHPCNIYAIFSSIISSTVELICENSQHHFNYIELCVCRPNQRNDFSPRPILPFHMPLQRTLTLSNLNDENLLKENNPMRCPSIFKSLKPPFMTTSPPTPRQSSPLGPCQNLLPAWPVFPPSKKKSDLYRQVLKKSVTVRQGRHIRRMGLERKNLGATPQGNLTH